MAASIFSKQTQLKPTAMAAVADRRFDDAQAICDIEQNARANGAAYLVGFVVEILLKARMVEKYSVIARKRQHEVSDDEREIWRLIWKQHDLEAMLGCLPELDAALKKKGQRDGKDYSQELKKLCSVWTIQARYSPHSILMDEAIIILSRVRELKEMLK